MQHPASEVLSLVGELADPARRREAAAVLAHRLGARDLLFFAPDPELGVPLPAPGFPQTLRGTAEWRRFLAECARRGEHRGTLRGPDGEPLSAVGCAVEDGTSAVLLGAAEGSLAPVRPILPLLGALFRNERRADATEVRLRTASEAAERARVLMQALQAMRAQLEGALVEAREARAHADEQARQAEELADELQCQATELEILNAELATRSAEAERARAAADAANRAKSEFLAVMSHELRTPINAIVGYAQLLAMGLAGPVNEAQRGQLERIRVSSGHLLSLINNLLDLAKVEAGRMTVEQEPAQVLEVVREAISLVEMQAAERQIAIRTPCEDPTLRYVGDRDRVRQVLLNLLSNAIKFTEPGGSIHVHFATVVRPDPGAHLPDTGTWTSITVEDSGIGIDQSELAHVFQPFVQADSGRTRSHGGTGLGLTISRQLARLMGGDLTVHSRRGKGSRFTLWLPADAAVAGVLDPSIRVAATEEREEVPAGLTEVGEALQAQVVSIAAGFARRLRAEPQLAPLVEEMDDAALLDHAPTFVADVAWTLCRLGSAGQELGALPEGSGVQRILAEMHGADRAVRGWNGSALRLELDLLSDEIALALQRSAGLHPHADLEGALAILDRLMDRAWHASLRGLQAATAGDPSSALA